MLLSNKDIAFYAIRTGYIYESMCDTEGCGKLIRPGELCIVLKWQKKEKGAPYFEASKAIKVRCMTCQNDMFPRAVTEVKVKAAGRGAKKVTADVASTIQIDVTVRKAIISIIKANGGSIEKGLLIPRLLKKKAIREMPKKILAATLRGMRKLKLVRGKQNTFILAKEKKAKRKKVAHGVS